MVWSSVTIKNEFDRNGARNTRDRSRRPRSSETSKECFLTFCERVWAKDGSTDIKGVLRASRIRLDNMVSLMSIKCLTNDTYYLLLIRHYSRVSVRYKDQRTPHICYLSLSTATFSVQMISKHERVQRTALLCVQHEACREKLRSYRLVCVGSKRQSERVAFYFKRHSQKPSIPSHSP